ncbi:hypothetical protein BIZ83_gp147 [Erwinia phage vB_EamM_ChrisDB]|uniref:hypothetical protein n=1 Tax=Erwinia phage vB_EamM_ChrisDB TaxID=1883371 RepID=UPI00081CF233|nr:hypothetical protein BIZ83_gp147 [Erwinia phage vB_EamM_ChrisDB]ANZ48706.1 hypothetical protein CHRISDB_144 [Erwinia phage vB_EamM_ChrisDB]
MAVSLRAVNERIRKYFGLPPKPTYQELEEEVTRLRRDNRSLVNIAHDALKRSEDSDSRALRMAGMKATEFRWPGSRQLMLGSIVNYGKALRKRRDKTRYKLLSFCVRFNVKPPEVSSD